MRVYSDRDLPLYLCVRALSRVAVLVQSVSVGWQVYALTRSPLALGIVGLVEFVPMFLLALPAGELADRLDPRKIVALASLLEAISSALLLAFVLTRQTSVAALYAIILLYGTARGFSRPAAQSLLPFLVPPEKLPSALAWVRPSLSLRSSPAPRSGASRTPSAPRSLTAVRSSAPSRAPLECSSSAAGAPRPMRRR